MDISDYREKIDAIDSELIRLFDERMRVAEQIAAYKKEKGLAVVDPAREREKLEAVAAASAADMADYNKALFSLIMKLSSDHQLKVMEKEL